MTAIAWFWGEGVLRKSHASGAAHENIYEQRRNVVIIARDVEQSGSVDATDDTAVAALNR
jgi:hypothetical protein